MSDSAAFTGVDLAEVAREIGAHRQGARAVRCTGRIAALGVGLLWLVALFLGGAGSVGKAGRSGSVVPNGRVWPTGGPPRHAAVVQPLAFPTTKSSNSKPVKAGIRMPCDRSFT